MVKARDGENEVKAYEKGRVLGSIEAAAKLYGSRHFYLKPGVDPLGLHEPGQQNVYFNDYEGTDGIEMRSCDTQLTAYFQAVRDTPGAKTLKYSDMPRFFLWNPKDAPKKWRLRAGLCWDAVCVAFRPLVRGETAIV